jgi:penicillin-binding protein 1A
VNPVDQSTPPTRPPRRRKRFSVLRFFFLLTIALALFGGGMAYWGYREFDKDLPQRWSALTDYRPPKASRVYSAEGELIGEFYLEKRVVVPADKIPRHLIHAFVAAEDNRFFEHHGVDPLGILRAAIANLRAGRVVQGGSTMTQQVAKLMLVGSERKLERKIREAMLAWKIERRLTKDQILTIYLNHVYLGHGAYGVQAAAEVYFGKDVDNLSIAEAAMLAGLPKAPTEDSPYTAFPRARDRQRYVLSQMVENGFITQAQATEAQNEPIAIISRDTPLNHVAAPYFVEYVRKYVTQKLTGQNIFNTGLRIYTTLSMRQQRSAETAVRRGLEDLDRRLGFRGPIGHLDGAAREAFLRGGPTPYALAGQDAQPVAGVALLDKSYAGLIESLRGLGGRKSNGFQVALGAERFPLVEEDVGRIERWTGRKNNHLQAGDLIPVKVVNVEVKKKKHVDVVRMVTLAQRPDVQAALVAVDPATGWLTAMVGGYDYQQSQFNRAVQARRQAGSSIKPYIYAAAVEKGFTEVSIVPDAPVAVHTAAGIWAPHNYKNEFLGPVTLRTALAKSLNTVSVRLVEAVGVDNTIEMFRRFGITSPIPRHISIALGVPELSPIEAAYAQATFPAGGMEVPPVFITRIVDADGKVLEDNSRAPQRKRRIGADTSYVMVDLMKNVCTNGTGKKALALGRPVAGKTGTSNDFKDAWFVGYTSDLLAVVWVGRDDFKTIGYDTTGGQTALPLWLDFMQHGHPDTPVRDFPPPPSVLLVRATGDKGQPAKPGTPNSVLIPFRRGTLPRDWALNAQNATFADGVF